MLCLKVSYVDNEHVKISFMAAVRGLCSVLKLICMLQNILFYSFRLFLFSKSARSTVASDFCQVELSDKYSIILKS